MVKDKKAIKAIFSILAGLKLNEVPKETAAELEEKKNRGELKVGFVKYQFELSSGGTFSFLSQNSKIIIDDKNYSYAGTGEFWKRIGELLMENAE